MGRRAMSPEQQEARGNPGKRPARKVAAAASIKRASIERPTWLTEEVSREVWDQVQPSLHFLRDSDVNVFGRYCVYMAGWIDATAQLAATGGSVYETSSKHVDSMMRLNPWFVVRSRLEDDLVKIEEKIGLTPLDRQRIIVQLAAAAQRPLGDLFGSEPQADTGEATEPAAPLPAPAGAVDTIGGLRAHRLDG